MKNVIPACPSALLIGALAILPLHAGFATNTPVIQAVNVYALPQHSAGGAFINMSGNTITGATIEARGYTYNDKMVLDKTYSVEGFEKGNAAPVFIDGSDINNNNILWVSFILKVNGNFGESCGKTMYGTSYSLQGSHFQINVKSSQPYCDGGPA